MKKETYAMYGDILREELLLAMGCTEPVAVAYAGAIARSVLDKPQSIRKCELYVSGNIIKNVKSVIVPKTDGMKGLETAVILGVIAGDETAGLQVISNVTALQREKTKQALRSCPVEVHTAPNDKIFYIEVRLTADGETSCTVIEDFHTHITRVEHNGVQQPLPHCGEAAQEAAETDRSHMTVEGILEYAETVDLEEVRFLLERQIQCNTAISEEGLKNSWGAQVGRTIRRGGRKRRAYERVRAASGHCFRQRKPRYDGIPAGHCLCKRTRCYAGKAAAGGADLRFDHHPPENWDRSFVRILRCHQRRHRRGVRHCMAGRRRLRGDCPYHRQRACNFVRYGV